MTKTSLLDTKTVSLNELLGNGKIYRVPQFQRDYSWDRDNWEDLWNDIEIASQNSSAHYMGSIVLQSTDRKEYKIIDGQQRFATLTILILAIVNTLQKLVDRGIEVDKNKERISILMNQYIGHKDPSSLTYSSKLFLNENNDGFFQSRLICFREPINRRKLSDSEGLLWDAYLYFKNKLANLFGDDGGKYASFLNNTVCELLMFIQITVENELNAYTVFETLNSRGVELTSTDLLKNYLFSLVAISQSDLKQVKDQWKKIIDIVGLKEFPNFLRYYLIATRKTISKEYLYKEIKNFVVSGQEVFELLESLQSYAYHYVALGNPDDDLWSADKELRSFVNLLKVFRVIQWKPLAMVAVEKYGLDSSEFKRMMRSLVALTFRYNVISKLQTNEMEKVFSRAAINLFKGESATINAVLMDLKPLYVQDEDFKSYFSVKQFNTNNPTEKKLLRYTLYKLESQEANGHEYDFETDNGTLEHILPESYPESWQDSFSEDEYERNVYMIGNMTLLESVKNSKEAADKVFDDKLIIYASSKFSITSSISTSEWTPQTVKTRQAHLAKIACGTWKIQF